MGESFAGKTVIVTGAGRGIGRAIAEGFAAAGANVVIAARTAHFAEAALADIRAAGGSAEGAIILKDSAEAPTPDGIKAFLKLHQLPCQVPVQFRLVSDFPRTPSMKPSMPGLLTLLAA